MAAAASLVLLLAPWASLEPVGQGDWESLPDPVARRWSSLLAGAPVRVGAMTVVPLFARVPGEAGGRAAEAAWPDGIEATVVRDHGRLYLRLGNGKDRPVLVQAGTVFTNGRSEAYAGRDVVVPPRFAVLVPAVANPRVPQPAGGAPLSLASILPAADTGLLLHGEGSPRPEAWAIHEAARYESALRHDAVFPKARAMWSRCRALQQQRGGTAVGCVLLVANRPQAAHVFASHELFMESLPDLLGGLAVRAREEELRWGGGEAPAQLALWGDPVGRSLAFVRTMMRAPAARAESYGEGFESLQASARERAMGHAVVDLRGTVVHAACFALEEAWPGGAGRRAGPGPVPQPPTGGQPETAPGVIDRKARPSVAEARQRARR